MSDLIDRQAAIKAVNNAFDRETLLTGFVRSIAVRAIRDMPSAQPEQQEGRFERNRDGVFCSVCHYGWKFITGVPAEVEREYRYCPNCGAKMGGGAG